MRLNMPPTLGKHMADFLGCDPVLPSASPLASRKLNPRQIIHEFEAHSLAQVAKIVEGG